MVRRRIVVAAAAVAIGTFSAYTHLSSGPDRLTRWQDRWDQKMTAWHVEEPHPLLLKYQRQLLSPQSHDSASPTRPSVLFPLCGSSVDLAALALRGYPVYGVEGVKVAVDGLLGSFGQEGVALPCEQDHRRLAAAAGLRLRTASAPGEAGSDEPAVLRAVEGDFLRLTKSAADAMSLPKFDAAFDRGALVAVAPSDRAAYASTLTGLMAPAGRVLLVAVEDDALSDGRLGPPFALSEAQVRELFGADFDVELLQREDRIDLEPTWRKRGCTHFSEAAYLLTRRSRAS